MAYILVADDDEDFANAVATVLGHAGHEVEVAMEIQAAIDSMERRRPDLLILDVMFPEDSSAGFKLARTIRHFNEKLKSVPVLMLTAVNTRFPLGFGARDIDDQWLPVADFVEKPVDFAVLQERVEAVLAGGAGEKAEQE
jgi:DNA-binding response OmpR family regulator